MFHHHRLLLLLYFLASVYNKNFCVDGKRQKNVVIHKLTWRDAVIEKDVDSEQSFCFFDTKSILSFKDFSNAISITLDVINEKKIEFPWHSVSVLSTDDFHQLVQNILGRLWGVEETSEVDLHDQETTSGLSNWLRDVVSSCPSPFFSTNRTRCSMTFSPYGKACVNLRIDKSMKIRATLHRRFEIRYIYALVLGILALWMANECSKSKIFQYLVGSLSFFVGGVFILGLMAGRHVMMSQSSRDDRQKQWWSSSMTTTGMVGLLSGGYGASMIWFLRRYLRVILLQYWEFAMIYGVISVLVGVIFVRMMRSTEDTRHLVRISVKWLIRCFGVICIFNGSSSPMISLFFMVVLVVLYTFYELGKNLRNIA